MPMPPTEPASHANDTEDQLVALAVEAISQSRWIVGECAAAWTRRFARGRTDADFGLLIGLSGDQVYQRRRVWEKFADLAPRCPNLKWSHFYTALGWDDFEKCLNWADDMRATVAEMKAWRRALRGEDLTADPSPEALEGTPLVQFVPDQPAWVQDPDQFRNVHARGDGGSGARDSEQLAVAGVAREFQSADPGYTPFRRDALQPPQRTDPDAVSSRSLNADQPTTLQLVKRVTVTLERFAKAASPAFTREYRDLPESVRKRFDNAVKEFQARVSKLD